jgi:hypothetical protein
MDQSPVTIEGLGTIDLELFGKFYGPLPHDSVKMQGYRNFRSLCIYHRIPGTRIT